MALATNPWVLAGGAVLLVGALAVIVVSRRRHQAGPRSPGGEAAPAPAEDPIEALRRQAISALIRADNALRATTSVVGATPAPDGPDTAPDRARAIAEAEKDVTRALGLLLRTRPSGPGSSGRHRTAGPSLPAVTPDASVPSSTADGSPATRPRSAASDLRSSAPRPGPASAKDSAAPPSASAPLSGSRSADPSTASAPQRGTPPIPHPASDAGSPSPAASERELLAEIQSLSTAAEARIDAVRHEQLRALEDSLEARLPDLAGRLASLEEHLATAQQTADEVEKRHPPATTASLRASLEQASTCLRAARASLAEARDQLASGKRGPSALRAREAAEALGQTSTLLEGVTRAPSVLDLAQRCVTVFIAQTTHDLDEAGTRSDAGKIPAVHFATETLAVAQASVASGTYDPILVRRALEESDTALHETLGPDRPAAATRARAESLLPTTTEAAEVAIRIVDEFITTRRGAVGIEARMRLAAAQQRLADGGLRGEPVAALGEMQAADHLADSANVLAQQDVARFTDLQRRGGVTGDEAILVLGGLRPRTAAPQG